ncbi:StAR-related lipid transfer protein 7, mitochondrial [Operophtera brumata]|uniref:StAR-related lipid transfer protein 7, mitochondrial n=1 Tax=Operophtera brumata TaxID=104452 RepID=A0A0L7L8S0_OPEBR|nr:StAR-related lipid transfer protein 7, mitochondrial [Operophtera brumata]
MSSVRFILRNLGVNKLRSVWTRSVNISNVVRRYRRDRTVRDVIVCFRQAFFRPRRTLLVSAAAAYNANSCDDEKPPSFELSISDEELEALLSELDAIEELSRTVYCTSCNKRLVIDKKQPGIRYCLRVGALHGGRGLYGRYREVMARHFAAVQVDGGYRRVWDTAVAALAVVERSASVPDQAVIHWEVLWPVKYNITSITTHSLFEEMAAPAPHVEERPSVHSNAKRKAIESYSKMGDRVSRINKLYIIISKSCEHPKVPETKHAIRVSEYWSHMVVRTLDGVDNDEPAGPAERRGGPAPAYLHKMRRAGPAGRTTPATSRSYTR